MICRDEAEAAQAAEELKKYVKIVETDLEKAEFGDGVMVLPVSYTKGLEFDAVLLFDPTQEKYPSDNGHVKLLYVAATRALHELVVLYRGKLTGILADKVPEGKHMKEFAAETLTKAAEFERVQHTEKRSNSSAGSRAQRIWQSASISVRSALSLNRRGKKMRLRQEEKH